MALRVLDNLCQLAYCCRVLSDRAVDGEWEVVGSLEKAAPVRVNVFLNRTSHIVLFTEKRGEKTRSRQRFARGEIVFRGVGGISAEVTHNTRFKRPVRY